VTQVQNGCGRHRQGANVSKKNRPRAGRRRIWLLAVAGVLVVLSAILVVWQVSGREPEMREAPEAQKILDVQANMPFQILIPAYLPRKFVRESVQIDVQQLGPGGEPMVQLAYRTKDGQILFLREWVPVNPDKEILAAARPVQTLWGTGWLRKQGESLIALWTDVGPLRVSTYANSQKVVSQEEVLQIASTLGPASNRQVFDFVLELPEVRAVVPPPPLEIPINEEGVQELTLVVTPGGYDPLRFQVRKDVPVRVTFRQLGQVGCGNELILPYSSTQKASAHLYSMSDAEVIEFTPTEVGEYQFQCSHTMYRGLMTVVP
jgi:hypothetical protein